MQMRFHHIGIATENIEEMLKKLERLLDITEVSEIVYDEQQNGKLCMLTLHGGVNIELVSGEVVKNIIKRGTFLYHSCFMTKNIEKKAEELIDEGYHVIQPPKKSILFHGKKVCFLFGEIGMIELLEEEVQ